MDNFNSINVVVAILGAIIAAVLVIIGCVVIVR
jgi:hypothetical protein